VASVLVVACVLSGCGSSAEGEGGSAARAQAKSAPSRVPDAAMAEMVAAVSGATGAPIEMKFMLLQKPNVGERMAIRLAVIPVSKLESVLATFQAGEGLELVSGEAMPQVSRPVPGVPLMHTVGIIPKRDGIFTVSAVVQADAADQSITRSFSIPIIAGAGIAQTP
jgi:hypothetical protein